MRQFTRVAVVTLIAIAACSSGKSSGGSAGGSGAVSSSTGGATGQSGHFANTGGVPAASSASNAGNSNAGATGGATAAGQAGAGRGSGGAGTRGGTGGHGSSGSAAGAGAGAAGDRSPSDAGAASTIDHFVTFYGWPDNDPPGNGIAYPKLHSGASGTGTYADPITFATDPKEWAPGTILYVPYLKRYVIMEDSCADCITDWSNGKHHIDIWVNSDGRLDSQVLACENALTAETAPIEVAPPPNRPVDATPLFDPSTGSCTKP